MVFSEMGAELWRFATQVRSRLETVVDSSVLELGSAFEFDIDALCSRERDIESPVPTHRCLGLAIDMLFTEHDRLS